MSRFIAPITEPITRTIPLGPCDCPGTPHKDGDTAEVFTQLGWDDLVDIGLAPTEGAAQRVLTTRAIASWSLEYRNGDGSNHPVPVNEATVRLLDPATLEAVAEAVNEAYEKAKAPLPKPPGAESSRLPEEQPSTPSTQTTAQPTS